MAEKKQEVDNIYIRCEEVDGEDGYRVEVGRKQKKSISQRAGWVPSSYQEPEKFTATSKEKLLAKLKEIL